MTDDSSTPPSPDETAIPPAMWEMPQSTKTVWFALRDIEPATRQDISAYTQTPERTVRWAIKYLDDRDLIEKRPVIGDARRSSYARSAPDDSTP